MSKNSHITGFGPPCFRCGTRTMKFEHVKVTDKMLRQPFYYAFWYRCENRKCRTTLIMPNSGIVWPAKANRPTPRQQSHSSDPHQQPHGIDTSKPPWDDKDDEFFNLLAVKPDEEG